MGDGFRNPAVEAMPRDSGKVSGYFVVGPGERVDGSRYPWGWQTPGFDDASWPAAAVLSPGGPRGIQDSPSRWMLVPRTIPLMEEKTERLARIARTAGPPGFKAEEEFLRGGAPLTVPAHTQVTLLFDQTYLTTAYPELVSTGGRGAEIHRPV